MVVRLDLVAQKLCWSYLLRSGNNLSDGRAGGSRLRRWRCGQGSCSAVPAACQTKKSLPGNAWLNRRSGNGVRDFLNYDWTGSGMTPRPCPGGRRSGGKIGVDTLESTPTNATHWSRTSMAKKSGLSPSTIGRIWHAFELKPHRTDGFKLSNDPMFVESLRRCRALPESA